MIPLGRVRTRSSESQFRFSRPAPAASRAGPLRYRRTNLTTESKTRSEVTRDELLQRASELVPVLKERAARTEALRRILPETVEDVVASGLIRIGAPKRFGGLDVSYELM